MWTLSEFIGRWAYVEMYVWLCMAHLKISIHLMSDMHRPLCMTCIHLRYEMHRYVWHVFTSGMTCIHLLYEIQPYVWHAFTFMYDMHSPYVWHASTSCVKCIHLLYDMHPSLCMKSILMYHSLVEILMLVDVLPLQQCYHLDDVGGKPIHGEITFDVVLIRLRAGRCTSSTAWMSVRIHVDDRCISIVTTVIAPNIDATISRHYHLHTNNLCFIANSTFHTWYKWGPKTFQDTMQKIALAPLFVARCVRMREEGDVILTCCCWDSIHHDSNSGRLTLPPLSTSTLSKILDASSWVNPATPNTSTNSSLSSSPLPSWSYKANTSRISCNHIHRHRHDDHQHTHGETHTL